MPTRAGPVFPEPDVPIVYAKTFLGDKFYEQHRYHKNQTLGFKNGIPVQIRPTSGIGGERLVQDLLLSGQQDDQRNLKEDEKTVDRFGAFGQTRPKSAPAFRPKFCFLDKKVLKFSAFFEEKAGLIDNPGSRIRHVNICYHLEDDTISIWEPRVENSGLYQGLVLKRHRIPMSDPLHGERAYWHWTDLVVGKSVSFYGRNYRLTSCDNFTREYLLSEGIEQDRDQPLPPDHYIEARLQRERPKSHQVTGVPGAKMKQYLENDRKVLRFYCTSGLPEYPLGRRGEQDYLIHFYLSDDSVEIREVRSEEEPKGAGSFPKFLKRQKLAKNRFSNDEGMLEFPSSRTLENEHYYGKEDFKVGKTVKILEKEFFIYGCDDFTHNYYKAKFNIDFERMSKPESSKPLPLVCFPPHTITSVGKPEDSVQNCRYLRPKAPRRDVKKLLDGFGKTLRFEACLDSIWPADKDRKFVFTYFLADDTISIFEMVPKNAGRMGGRYLIRSKVAKPTPRVDGEPDYYTIDDFFIDSVLHIYGRKFVIVSADERVLKYINENEIPPLPKHTQASLRQYFLERGYHVKTD